MPELTNDEVIEVLEHEIAALEDRRSELIELQDNPGGPFAEQADRQMQVYVELSKINLTILNLQYQKHDRELARDLKRDVPALSAARSEALADCITKVSQSIAAVQEFKNKIALAAAISAAASKSEMAATKDS